jgi:Gram-negative bacterial TonB protein C-terminal
MKTRMGLCAGLLLGVAQLHGQSNTSWPCADELSKADGDNHRVRVQISVTEAMVQKKILPDVSDLKNMKTKSTVVLRALIGDDGSVRCVDPMQGDSKLFARSVEAARLWQFQPYLLNGKPTTIETTLSSTLRKIR